MHTESQPRLYWAFKSHPPQQMLYSKHHACLWFLTKIMTVKMIEDFLFFKVIIRIINLSHKKHNQNLWPVQWWLVHAVWECSQRWYSGLLSHSQQFSPSPQIHPHSIKTSNYVLGYHSVWRQNGRKVLDIKNAHHTSSFIWVSAFENMRAYFCKLTLSTATVQMIYSRLKGENSWRPGQTILSLHPQKIQKLKKKHF